MESADHSFRSKLGLVLRWDWDRSVSYGMLTGLRSLLVGPITGLLVASWFTQSLQGYYYAFRSLLGGALAAELGLQLVIVPFISHEWVKLSVDQDGRPREGEARARWIQLSRGAVLWYCAMMPIMTVLLWGSGAMFMARSQVHSLDWEWPWLFVCGFAAVEFLTRPFFSILEGCQRVELVFRVRLWQGFISAGATWLTIMAGGGLWCLPAGVLAAILVALVMIHQERRLLSAVRSEPTGSIVSWKAEVWPMQWRIGLSSMAALLSAACVVPLVLYYLGAETAGRFGMSLALSQLVATVMGSWSTTRSARIAELVARRESMELHRLLYRLTFLSLVTGLISALATEAGVLGLHLSGNRLYLRLLPEWPTAILLASVILVGMTSPFAIYLRAHKKEPYLGTTLLNSISLVAFSWWLTPRYGITGTAFAYLLSAALMVPWSLWVWHRCRRRWYPKTAPQKAM